MKARGWMMLTLAAAAGIAALCAACYFLLTPAAAPNIRASASCDPTRDVFYVRQKTTPGSGHVEEIAVYKVNTDVSGADVELGSLKGYGEYSYAVDRRGRMLLYPADGPRQTLYSYSVCDGALSRLLALPESDREIMSARFAAGSDVVFVTTTEKNEGESAVKSRIETYEGGARTASAAISDASPKYAGVGIVGISQDASVVYLREAGGDGGYVWGAYYRWKKADGAAEKLGDFTIEGDAETDASAGYLIDAIDPTGKSAMRIVPAAYAASDLVTPSWQPAGSRCLTSAASNSGAYAKTGDKLMIRDLSTGAERLAYTNLMDVKNICQNRLRVITTPLWRDDTRVVFSMPYGIYEADISTGNARLIVARDLSTWNSGIQTAPRLIGANAEYLLTAQSSIIDIATGKEMSVPALLRDPLTSSFDEQVQFAVPIL